MKYIAIGKNNIFSPKSLIILVLLICLYCYFRLYCENISTILRKHFNYIAKTFQLYCKNISTILRKYFNNFAKIFQQYCENISTILQKQFFANFLDCSFLSYCSYYCSQYLEERLLQGERKSNIVMAMLVKGKIH